MAWLDDAAQRVAGALGEKCKAAGDNEALYVLLSSEPALMAHEHGIARGEDVPLYRLILAVPLPVYEAVKQHGTAIKDRLDQMLAPIQEFEWQHFATDVVISYRLDDNPKWREAAENFLAGQGITNQGRVRSTNPAPYEHHGLFFRSNPEILLCDALLNRGIPFAPLAVFLKGDNTYHRIENDFTLLYKGRICVVEVDGPYHLETPVAAQERLDFMLRQGAELRRVRAEDCNTPEKAAQCVDGILAYFDQRFG